MSSIRDIFTSALRLTPVVLSLLFAANNQANAATDTLSVTLHYRPGSPVFEADYRGNDRTIEILNNIAASADSVVSVSIVSSASPEGNTLFNQQLSELRSQTALALVDFCTSISVNSIGIDWNGLATRLDSLTDRRFVNQAAHLIRTTPEWIIEGGIITDSRKLRLRNLDGGHLWQFMLDSIFPELRVSKINIVYTRKLKQYGDHSYHAAHNLQSDPLKFNLRFANSSLTKVIKESVSDKNEACFALRTNLILDAVAVPNLGIEIALGRKWSATVSGMYAWWSNSDRGRYWRLQGVELTVRRYFGKNHLGGHHFGVYGQMLRYDFCLGKKGALNSGGKTSFFNHPTVGVGVEYGYSFRIGGRLRLDLSLGAGYLSGRYVTYKIKDGISYLTSTRNRRYFGPTRAEASLAWIIGKGGIR